MRQYMPGLHIALKNLKMYFIQKLLQKFELISMLFPLYLLCFCFCIVGSHANCAMNFCMQIGINNILRSTNQLQIIIKMIASPCGVSVLYRIYLQQFSSEFFSTLSPFLKILMLSSFLALSHMYEQFYDHSDIGSKTTCNWVSNQWTSSPLQWLCDMMLWM